MTTDEVKKEEAKKEKNEAITFKCKFCDTSKPFNEMMVMTRFFPPTVACQDCVRKMNFAEEN